MKYVVDDKKLNAATFIAFVNQVWQGSYDYVENTEFPPEMVSSLMKTKNVLELSWDEWMMNIEVEDMEDSIKKVAELLRERKI